MYAVAAVFVLTYCFNLWVDAFAPRSAGFSTVVFGSLEIASVEPNGPMAQASVRRGDVIEAADGHTLTHIFDWGAARMQFELHRPVDLQVRRGSERLHVQMVIDSPAWRTWDRRAYVVLIAIRGSQLFCLALALLVAFSRPDHLTARLLALMFAVIAAFNPIPQYGWAAMARHLPAPLALPMTLASASGVLGPILWVVFFGVFPRPSVHRRWLWAVLLAPGVLSIPVLAWAVEMVYAPTRAFGISWTLLASYFFLGLAQDCAGVALLFRSYFRAEDVNDRRRLRTLLIATCVGLPAALLTLWPLPDPWPLLGAVLFVICPAAFAYALLKQRMFDIALIIRQGLQYALARNVIVFAVPASIALLVLDLVLHRQQTLAQVIASRGWFYAVVGVLAVLAYRKHDQWLGALDRRFFRERYNAQQLLREVVDSVRQAAGFAQEAPRVTARIEAALHAEFVALLVREPRQPSYSVIASSPAGSAPPALLAESKILALMRLLGKPLDVSRADSSWLGQQLPPEDTRFLRESRLELLVPVSIAADRKEALLALGRKRSEEPYSGEDVELLQAIASALTLLIERAAAPAYSGRFEECPQCGSLYDSGTSRCENEGAALTGAAFPRTLAGRYRLQKRLGRGGMGTVYRATDTALEREVALKMIREDLVANPEAAERFRREAKAAAAITHANLVTLYDFAVDEGNRAFLVMELLSGRTLRAELQRQGAMPRERMLEIIAGICAGLAVAHERGLVHRDLKPENVFLAPAQGSDVPKLLDFGLAKFLGPSASTTQEFTVDTGKGMLVGTPQYMPPEQLKGEAVSPGWDLWALAIMTYEMITGAYPFAGANSVAALHNAVLSGQFTEVRSHVPHAPPSWQEFFARSLSPDSSRRPASAREFAAECGRVFVKSKAQRA
jgi:tRNA A-37 threonylcarbamoyl transferase component Bud32